MIAVAVFVVGLVLAGWAAVIDARTHRLPNRLVGPLALVGVIGLAVASISASHPRHVEFALGALVFAGPWLAINLFAPSAVGFGDVKYAAALGIYLAWFDPMAGVTALALTVALAWPQSLVQAIAKRGTTLALGPYLLGGAVGAALLSAR